MDNRTAPQQISAVALVFTLLCLTGCVNPKTLPGASGLVNRETERITKGTEEAIKKSVLLQELDHLCTQEISVPGDFLLVSRDTGTITTPAPQTFLGYGYRSNSQYEHVKKFYKDRLIPKGWQLAIEKDSTWGSPYMEFDRDSYKVKVYRMAGGDEPNYSLQCGKVSDAAPR